MDGAGKNERLRGERLFKPLPYGATARPWSMIRYFHSDDPGSSRAAALEGSLGVRGFNAITSRYRAVSNLRSHTFETVSVRTLNLTSAEKQSVCGR